MFLVVIIELFQNSVFQLYFPKDYYKQKQWNTLPVTMITEIMNFIDYYGGCHGNSGKYLCLAILTNNEVPFFAQYNLFGANVHMCYDYVHLDNLSDISGYRNHNVFLCPIPNQLQSHGVSPCIVTHLHALLNCFKRV